VFQGSTHGFDDVACKHFPDIYEDSVIRKVWALSDTTSLVEIGSLKCAVPHQFICLRTDMPNFLFQLIPYSSEYEKRFVGQRLGEYGGPRSCTALSGKVFWLEKQNGIHLCVVLWRKHREIGLRYHVDQVSFAHTLNADFLKVWRRCA
jgi:hypothetical protein